MFTSGFQSFAFQTVGNGIASVVGRLKKKARELTRQRHRAHTLAEKYNKAREQSRMEAERLVSVTVEQFTQKDKREALPPSEMIDFEALASSREATRRFLEAIDKVNSIVAEEEEIFSFMMAIA